MPRPTSTLTNLDRLQKSSFVRRVLEDAARVDRDTSDPASRSLVEATPVRNLSEAEFHSSASGFALSHLLGLLDQLAKTPAYVLEYRRTKSLAARRVTRAADLTYHLEAFVVRTSMLEERVLQLCSAVCHTGLPLNAVSERAILKNSSVLSMGLSEPLKEFRKLCQPYAQVRNQVVHQHGYLDADLRRVELLLLASRTLPGSQRYAAASSYRFLIGQLAEAKGRELDTFARSAIEATSVLFVALDGQYQRRQRQLHVAN